MDHSKLPDLAGDELFTPGDIRRAIIAGVEVGVDASKNAYTGMEKFRLLLIAELLVAFVLLILVIIFGRDVSTNSANIEKNTKALEALRDNRLKVLEMQIVDLYRYHPKEEPDAESELPRVSEEDHQ